MDCTQQVFAGVTELEAVEYTRHQHSWIVMQTDKLQIYKLSGLDRIVISSPRTVTGNVNFMCITLKHVRSLISHYVQCI